MVDRFQRNPNITERQAMPSYSITLGLTVQAYCCVDLDAADDKAAIEEAKRLLDDKGDDEPVEILWDTADDYRLVSVKKVDPSKDFEGDVLTTEEIDAINEGVNDED